MPLPKQQHITFSLTIPTTKEVFKFRPFVGREEKILLVAKESKKISEIIDAIRQIIINCATEYIDLEKLSLIDLEYLFIKLRAVSVNNIQEMAFIDKEEEKEKGVNVKPREFEIDLNNVEVVFNEKHNDKIQIDDHMTLDMRYPSADIPKDIFNTTNGFETITNLLKNCIVSVHNNDEVFYFKDQTEEEIVNFLEDLSLPVYEKIKEFFATLPKLFYKIEYTNFLGHTRIITLDKLEDFFTMG